MTESRENLQEDPSGESSVELVQQLKAKKEALQSAYEQLLVAEEELRVQNEELTASYALAQDAQNRFRELFDEAPDAYIVTDPGGKILEANHAASVLFGCAAEKLKAYKISDLIPALNKGFSRLAESRWEGLAFRLSGMTFWSSISATTSRNSVGEPASVRWLIRDIADRKKVDDALQRSESRATALASQLRELASELTLAEQRERQRIAKILHDEIQQSLVAAKMQTSTLLNRQPNSEMEATLNLIYELLGQTISVSRTLTSELSPPVLYDIGLGPALNWLARNFLEIHGLEVVVLFDPAAEPKVEDVRLFLFDAIREILFNVVKHSGVRKAQIKCIRGKDDLLRIVISDEGKGFDPAIVEAVGKSEGFGLFSIQQRLKHMGGRMEIGSNPDRGTRITIIGPPAPKAISRESASAEATVSSKIRLVLADDHNIIREGLAQALRSQPDFDVVGEAANGVEAVDLALSLHPDVVIMDVSMPVLSGIEATAKILSDMPDIKIIGLSMHEEGELSSAIREVGAVGYVTKGGRPESLLAAIRKAAGR